MAANSSPIPFSFSSRTSLPFSSLHVTTPQTAVYSTSASLLKLYISNINRANMVYSLSILCKSHLIPEEIQRDYKTFAYQISNSLDIVQFSNFTKQTFSQRVKRRRVKAKRKEKRNWGKSERVKRKRRKFKTKGKRNQKHHNGGQTGGSPAPTYGQAAGPLG